MSFICKNTDCSAPENKREKVYPSPMECPFCDFPLVEVISFYKEEITLINSLPYVIAYPLKRAIAEKHAWIKINLLKDTFLNYLKYLGLLSASEFFNSDIKDKGMVALFHKNLMETAFGKWNHYIRECLAFLKQQNHTFFYPELVAYYELVETGSKSKKYKGEIEYQDANGDTQIIVQTSITSIGVLINFRNRYLGHGQTLDEVKSTELWNEYFPIFRYLLEQLSFTKDYPMLKHEHGETYLLHSSEIKTVKSNKNTSSSIWIENKEGQTFDILPFFIVPGEVSLAKEDKEQLLTYESYTGKTIKFFSPEGTEKQTSGKILERLNLLLRDKLKEEAYSPEQFTKEIFTSRIDSENKLLLDILIAEKKVIPGVYVHREEFEIKLREWIGARANIFFIAAEAGSGKTNLLVEIQKQYQERDYSSMIIRAGRMEKNSLKKQIAYILNIDENTDISEYKAITGTQDKPVFILIDGLNEASYAEAIWQEIIELSKQFTPGSLKFVISSRANTKADIDRYIISAEEENFIYGEKKENEKGLSAYCHWLTALNMVEMKNAWENYMSKDKSKFKPQFTFDDLATFDRALYNQINNPLILRLFLEIYNGKSLPKKGNKHLNIWGDWLNTFTEAEQTFFKLIANEIWIKGENELLLDDLLNNPELKQYFTTDVINAPYPRLKNNGWISRYVKDLNSYVAFTVEGSLLYLLGVKLQQLNPALDLNSVHEILSDGNKLKRSAIESFLCRESLNGKLELVCEIIDAYEEHHDICVTPLLYFLKAFGPKAMLDIVLANPTDNDWKVLLILNKLLDRLVLQILIKEFNSNVIDLINFNNRHSTKLGLRAVLVIDKEQARNYFSRLNHTMDFMQKDSEILFQLGNCEEIFSNYDKALEYYDKGLNIVLKNESFDPIVAEYYDSIGSIWLLKGDFEKAIEFKQKSLTIILINNCQEDIAIAYNNVGNAFGKKGDFENALKYIEKSIFLSLNIYGHEHPIIATAYSNKGVILNNLCKYDEAIDYYEMGLTIQLKNFGQSHSSVALSYNNLAVSLSEKGENDLSLEYLKKCLAIQLATDGSESPNVALTYSNIGATLMVKEGFDNAIEFYEKSLAIIVRLFGSTHPEVSKLVDRINLQAEIWLVLGEYHKSLSIYERSLELLIKNLGHEHPCVAHTNDYIGSCYSKQDNFEKALYYFETALKMFIKNYSPQNKHVATTKNKIGTLYYNKQDFLKAMEYYENSLNIQLLAIETTDQFDLATTYSNLGLCLENTSQYIKAIKFYKKSLEIILKIDKFDTYKVSSLYFNIGKCYQSDLQFNYAIQYYERGFSHEKTGGYAFKMAECYELLGDKEAAIDNFKLSSVIRKEDPEVGLEHHSTLDAINNAIRLAKELGKEDELPDWMK